VRWKDSSEEVVQETWKHFVEKKVQVRWKRFSEEEECGNQLWQAVSQFLVQERKLELMSTSQYPFLKMEL